MRGIVIDPEKRVVCEYNVSGREEIREVIDADVLAQPLILENGDCLIIDDEGLIKHEMPHGMVFRAHKSVGYQYGGRVVVVGRDDEGEWTDAKSGVEEIQKRIVKWLKPSEITIQPAFMASFDDVDDLFAFKDGVQDGVIVPHPSLFVDK